MDYFKLIFTMLVERAPIEMKIHRIQPSSRAIPSPAEKSRELTRNQKNALTDELFQNNFFPPKKKIKLSSQRLSFILPPSLKVPHQPLLNSKIFSTN